MMFMPAVITDQRLPSHTNQQVFFKNSWLETVYTTEMVYTEDYITPYKKR